MNLHPLCYKNVLSPVIATNSTWGSMLGTAIMEEEENRRRTVVIVNAYPDDEARMSIYERVLNELPSNKPWVKYVNP